MKVTIIGANSYIARNITVMFLQRTDVELYLYDYQAEHFDHRAVYEQINILDKKSVEKINLKVDLVFMFVGKTGSLNGFDDYNTFIDINERALLNLLDEYRHQESGAKVIFPSTRLVYRGKEGKLPETSEKEAKTIYAANKIACEHYLQMYHNVYGIQYCILRICVPYGTQVPEASSYGTAEFMLNKAKSGEDISLYGNGEVRRTLTYMEDLCNIMIEAGLNANCVNDVYNVGGEDYSLREMAEQIAKAYDVGIKYVPWPESALRIESGNTVFDFTKLENIIGKYKYFSFEDWIGRQ